MRRGPGEVLTIGYDKLIPRLSHGAQIVGLEMGASVGQTGLGLLAADKTTNALPPHTTLKTTTTA